MTYGDYLQLHDLLKLQGEDRGINSDEMHFIIVHQAFELWFKQVIRELSEARDILDQVPVPEDDIPRVVDHLTRTAEIFRLMADQWSVLETLTPQGFLAFRDELGTASGFQSFQMRELEILLGRDEEVGEDREHLVLGGDAADHGTGVAHAVGLPRVVAGRVYPAAERALGRTLVETRNRRHRTGPRNSPQPDTQSRAVSGGSRDPYPATRLDRGSPGAGTGQRILQHLVCSLLAAR